MENLRSWVALCLMDIFILELVSNQLTVTVKIDRLQQQDKTHIGAIDKPEIICAGLQVKLNVV